MPHSMSGSGGELNSVRLRTSTNTGTETEAQIDAQEDRLIIGYRLDVDGVGVGDDAVGDLELFVGTDPDPGNSEDIGSKLYDKLHYLQDATNGVTNWQGLGVTYFLDTEHAFDWNEDATLSIRHNNAGSSSGSHEGEAVVYYVER